MSSQPTSQTTKSDSDVASEFSQYYLQRTTQELAEDLDKVRAAEDFKNDAISMLVHALQQGADMFSPEDKRRIVAAAKTEEKESWERMRMNDDFAAYDVVRVGKCRGALQEHQLRKGNTPETMERYVLKADSDEDYPSMVGMEEFQVWQGQASHLCGVLIYTGGLVGAYNEGRYTVEISERTPSAKPRQLRLTFARGATPMISM